MSARLGRVILLALALDIALNVAALADRLTPRKAPKLSVVLNGADLERALLKHRHRRGLS